MRSLGLSEAYEGITEMFKILNEFYEHGYPYSGKIKIIGTKREAHMILTTLLHIESSVCLKYNPNV